MVSCPTEYRCEERVPERTLRRYGSRPEAVRVERDARVLASIDQESVEAAVRQRGWRVYAANHPAAQCSLQQAVLAYRSEYLIELNMGRLQGQPLSLTPMYLEGDGHVTGLIRLLSVGFRELTRLEFVVRCVAIPKGNADDSADFPNFNPAHHDLLLHEGVLHSEAPTPYSPLIPSSSTALLDPL
jgi:hypothetical protein